MIGKQKGAAIVEFVLMVPLLLVLTMITTEFGRAIYQYNLIVKSLHNAARYLSVQTPNTQIAATKNLVVYGNIGGTGTALVPGLSISNVNLDAASWQLTGSYPLIRTVTVTVSGFTFHSLYSSVFGVTFTTLGGNISYGPISATMRCPS